MKLLAQFPTLGRPQKFLHCLQRYVDLSSEENEIHFNINCDVDDVSMNNDIIKDKITQIINSKQNISYALYMDKNTNKISAINDHIENRDFDVVICLSDDMLPIVTKWDKVICDNMQLVFPDTFGCLHFNDGYTGNKLITLSILGKKLYDYFGYIYHPDYKSLYCDDEFTQEVYNMNKVKYIDSVIISHEHYSRDGNINSGDYDFAAQKTIYYSGRDGFVFKNRKELGFPKHRITND